MNFIKTLFKKKEKAVNSYDEFWSWFRSHSDDFYHVVKSRRGMEEKFFNKLGPKLDELQDGFWYLTGMHDEQTAELIFTADGVVRNIVFVEELVAAAPELPGWKFTAFKPALDIQDVAIDMKGCSFSADNLSFYPNDYAEYPDEIDITIVHHDFAEELGDTAKQGVHIFLDNYLGELDFANTIDNLTVIGKEKVEKELIPIAKLKEYLNWRQKEFVEKYDGTRHDTSNDTHSVLEAELESGNMLVAVVNTDLLNWENKASHPWILTIEIPYDGSSNNGMPNKATSLLLNEIQEEITEELKDADGYLFVARQTAKGTREIYFACKEFRKPSKFLLDTQRKYADRVELSYDIYKDKYWQSFSRFNVTE